MLADTNTANAIVGLMFIAAVLLVIGGLVIALVKTTGRASRAEGERDYLRREIAQLRQQSPYGAPAGTYPPASQTWGPPPAPWGPPGGS